ncbi:MAG: DNA-3-methyladenine glycosylase [candidate division Zixibacteria bacterium]|nr:DNA-3-methyladenine glycosylase [candidate division Zixibacteria bacterium]
MPRRAKKLPRSFYDRPTGEVARDILGKYIVYKSPEGRLVGRIVEVEAYIGQDDPACHAARGETGRNAVMFGPPGFSYIYFIYGMYFCLNFVTEKKGFGAAVLLRACEPSEGLDIMYKNSPRIKSDVKLLNGPGKFCRSFGMTRDQNALDLTGSVLYLEDRFEKAPRIGRSHRIGIRVGRDKLWRFFDTDSKAVTKS